MFINVIEQELHLLRLYGGHKATNASDMDIECTPDYKGITEMLRMVNIFYMLSFNFTAFSSAIQYTMSRKLSGIWETGSLNTSLSMSTLLYSSEKRKADKQSCFN